MIKVYINIKWLLAIYFLSSKASLSWYALGMWTLFFQMLILSHCAVYAREGLAGLRAKYARCVSKGFAPSICGVFGFVSCQRGPVGSKWMWVSMKLKWHLGTSWHHLSAILCPYWFHLGSILPISWWWNEGAPLIYGYVRIGCAGYVRALRWSIFHQDRFLCAPGMRQVCVGYVPDSDIFGRILGLEDTEEQSWGNDLDA